jgi:DNA-binding transcriptional LysR family regulator
VNGTGVELRLMRTFVAVARRGSFSRAAEDLHIAQQAVSQQVAALERALGATVFDRRGRTIALTPAGTVFLAESRRVLAAADRAVRRVHAAARGESGTLRLAYTLTASFETVPALLERLGDALPDVEVVSREVFGGDIPELLLSEAHDLAIAPATSYPDGFVQRIVRREPMKLAVSASDELADRGPVSLRDLRDRTFETWPRDMSPGFYDVVLAACRAAGFEPRVDEHATGNAVWGFIAEGRGVGLIDASADGRLPKGVALVELAGPPIVLALEAVWRAEGAAPVVERVLEIAGELARDRGWGVGS